MTKEKLILELNAKVASKNILGLGGLIAKYPSLLSPKEYTYYTNKLEEFKKEKGL
jgi:hypothetical protein